MGSFSIWHWLVVLAVLIGFLAVLIGIGWWISSLFKRR
jgi:hypothetical protein